MHDVHYETCPQGALACLSLTWLTPTYSLCPWLTRPYNNKPLWRVTASQRSFMAAQTQAAWSSGSFTHQQLLGLRKLELEPFNSRLMLPVKRFTGDLAASVTPASALCFLDSLDSQRTLFGSLGFTVSSSSSRPVLYWTRWSFVTSSRIWVWLHISKSEAAWADLSGSRGQTFCFQHATATRTETQVQKWFWN